MKKNTAKFTILALISLLHGCAVGYTVKSLPDASEKSDEALAWIGTSQGPDYTQFSIVKIKNIDTGRIYSDQELGTVGKYGIGTRSMVRVLPGRYEVSFLVAKADGKGWQSHPETAKIQVEAGLCYQPRFQTETTVSSKSVSFFCKDVVVQGSDGIYRRDEQCNPHTNRRVYDVTRLNVLAFKPNIVDRKILSSTTLCPIGLPEFQN